MAWVKIPKEHHPVFERAMPADPRAETMKSHVLHDAKELRRWLAAALA